MEAITELSQKVSDAVVPSGRQPAGSFLDIIMQLLPVILDAFENCNQSPKGLAARAEQGRFFDRIWLRLVLRRQLGVRQFRAIGARKLERAFFEVAKREENEELIEAAMQEID